MKASERRDDRGDQARAVPAEARSGIYLRARDRLGAAAAHDELRDAMHGEYVVLDAYGRILGVAPGLASRLGFEPERLVGKRLAHRIASTWRSSFQVALALLRTTGKLPDTECTLWTKSFDPLKVVLSARATSGIGDRAVVVAAVAC